MIGGIASSFNAARWGGSGSISEIPVYITERERGLVGARRTLGAVDQLPLEIVGVSRATVRAAAHIKARFPISYADAFAVVTGQDHGGVVMTGDPEFELLANAGLVAVEWLPRRRP